MKKQHRPYQLERIDNTINLIEEHRTICSQLPTGGGKTFEFADIAMKYTRYSGKSVLILVHREELLNQALKTFKENYHVDPVLITAKTRHYQTGRIYIGMVDSLVRRLHLIGDLHLLIIDECHQDSFKKIHDIFPEINIIGYTATPLSASKKDPLNNYYEKIVIGPQIKELIKDGYLAQNITRCPREVIDLTKLEIDNRKGDFNEHMMATEFSKPRYVVNVVANYERFLMGKKTLIFNVTKDHSKLVTLAFKAMKHNVRHLDSDCSPEERKDILEWFKNTPDAILCNVMIATVGFDEPTVEAIILNFSTLSLVKFIQCCGRGSRKLDWKDYFDIIDMGGNCIRFGDWCDDRDWEDMFYNPPKPGEGVAPVKTCPQCQALVHASAMTCHSFLPGTLDECGYEWERKKQEEEKIMDEMIVITRGINVDHLIRKNKNKYDYFTFLEIGEKLVRGMYENYPKPSETLLSRAFDTYYGQCIEWYRKTLAGKDGNPLDISTDSWHIKRAKYNFDDLVRKLNPDS